MAEQELAEPLPVPRLAKFIAQVVPPLADTEPALFEEVLKKNENVLKQLISDPQTTLLVVRKSGKSDDAVDDEGVFHR